MTAATIKVQQETGMLVNANHSGNFVYRQIEESVQVSTGDALAVTADPTQVMQYFKSWLMKEVFDSNPPKDIQQLAEAMIRVEKKMATLDEKRDADKKVFSPERIVDIRFEMLLEYLRNQGECGQVPSQQNQQRFLDIMKDVGRLEFEKYQRLIYQEILEGTYVSAVKFGQKDPTTVIENYKQTINQGFINANGEVNLLKLYTQGLAETIEYGRIAIDFLSRDELTFRRSAERLTRTREYEAYFNSLTQALQSLDYPLLELSFIPKKQLNFQETIKALTIKKNVFNPFEEFIQILRSGVKIRHINLSCVRNDPSSAFCGLACCCLGNPVERAQEELQEFVIKVFQAVKSQPVTLEALSEFSLPATLIMNDEILVGMCELLERGALKSMSIPGIGKKTVTYFLKCCQCMRKEAFSLQVTTQVFNRFTEAIANSSLESIDFSNLPFEKDDLSYLSTKPRLCCGDEYGEQLLNSVLSGVQSKQIQLKRINLAYNDLGKHSAVALAQIIANSPLLSHVDIRGNDIAGSHFSNIVKEVRRQRGIFDFRYEENQGVEVEYNKCMCVPVCCSYDIFTSPPLPDDVNSLLLHLLTNRVYRYALRILINVSDQKAYVDNLASKLFQQAKDLREETEKKKKKQEDEEFQKRVCLAKAGASSINFDASSRKMTIGNIGPSGTGEFKPPAQNSSPLLIFKEDL